MAQRYTQIMPADDWYYVCYPTEINKELIVWELAAWALTATTGEVVGLVSIAGEADSDPGKLVAIPSLKGKYKRRSELTENERRASYRKDA